jgi:hypothetical protein
MSADTLRAAAPAAPSAARVIANFLLFQLGWFAAVLGGAHNLPWAGAAVALTIVVFHLASAPRPRPELVLIGIATAVGAAWDSLLVAMGWLVFASGTLVAGLAPLWIVAMYALFATTLNASLNWLKGRYLMAALFGAIGGPLAYYAGEKLGGVSFPDPLTAMTALALGWGALMPLLMVLARRFDGINAVEPVAWR